MKAKCPRCGGEGQVVADVLPAGCLGHLINVVKFRACTCRGFVDQGHEEAVQVLSPLDGLSWISSVGLDPR